MTGTFEVIVGLYRKPEKTVILLLITEWKKLQEPMPLSLMEGFRCDFYSSGSDLALAPWTIKKIFCVKIVKKHQVDVIVACLIDFDVIKYKKSYFLKTTYIDEINKLNYYITFCFKFLYHWYCVIKILLFIIFVVSLNDALSAIDFRTRKIKFIPSTLDLILYNVYFLIYLSDSYGERSCCDIKYYTHAIHTHNDNY